MSGIEIERLATGDETRLRAIRLRALAEAPDAFGTTFAEADALTAEAWRQQLEELATFVATAGGHDIGIVRGGLHEDQSDAAYLLSMWIAPEMRRQGVAAALIKTVIEWATGTGFQRLVLDVAESNLAAMNLYVKQGFAANGTLGALPPPRQHIREIQLELTLLPDRS